MQRMNFSLIAHSLKETTALIYMWEIRTADGDLLGRYVGKAKNGASRPLTHYPLNVANLLANKPYRKGNPYGFRRIHRALAEAQVQGHRIELSFLCNVKDGENINELEQKFIRDQNSSGDEPWQLNGPSPACGTPCAAI